MSRLLIILLLIPSFAFAQKEDYNWTFADSNRIYFDVQNDNTILSKSFIPYMGSGASECQATFSDSLGNLLFYLKTGFNQVPDVNKDTFNVLPRGGG